MLRLPALLVACCWLSAKDCFGAQASQATSNQEPATATRRQLFLPTEKVRRVAPPESLTRAAIPRVPQGEATSAACRAG
jgi:hypothetical protein